MSGVEKSERPVVGHSGSQVCQTHSPAGHAGASEYQTQQVNEPEQRPPEKAQHGLMYYNITHNYGNVQTSYITDNRVDNSVDNQIDNSIRNTATTAQYRVWSDNIAETQERDIQVALSDLLPLPTELFTGNKSRLEKMRAYFEIDTSLKLSEESFRRERRVFVLYGLGGSGKTQLALKFADLHWNWFAKIFFVDSTNAEVLNLQLINIASQVKAGETAKEALAWVATQRGWLLIFDNADDPYLNLKQYFPSGNHGNIIITTRNKACIAYASQSHIHMTDFSETPDDAVQLLLKASLLEPQCNEVTLQLVHSLTKELGYLPLAITQAGAYISQHSITIGEYLKLFRERRKELLTDWNTNIQNRSDHDRPVYAAWDISYQRLDDSAKDFLKMCAFLHREGIPKALFDTAIPELLGSKPQITLGVEAWKKVLRRHWTSDGKWDALKFNRTIAQLTSYSFVTITSHSPVSGPHTVPISLLYSIHELVHCWVRDSLDSDAENLRAVQTIVKKLICAQLSLYSSNYQALRQLLPHTLAAITDIQDLDPYEILLVGATYNEIEQLTRAEEIGTQAMPIIVNILGKEHPVTLRCMYNLANTYCMQGRYSEAQKLYMEVLEAKKRILGEEHPSTLITINNLALVYKEQGQLEEAERMYINLIETRRRIMGEDHTETLTSMNNLAQIYDTQGRYGEAQKLYMKVLEAKKRILGEEHPSTLITINNLALVYREQGQLEEAERMYINLIETRRRIMGEDHTETLTSINNLAQTYHIQGRYGEAQKLYIEVLEAKKRILGEEHPSTLITINNLALVYKEQGQLEEAERIYINLIETRRRIMGEDHTETLTSMNNLAQTYYTQGRYGEAQKLYMEVLEAKKRILGEEHPSTLITINNLALVYKEQEQLEEAERMYINLIETRRRILGEDNREVLISMGNLAQTYYRQGRYNEAEKLHMEVLEAEKRILGEEHPDTLITMTNLALVYREQGRLEEAEKLQTQAVEGRKKVLGEQHPAFIEAVRKHSWTLAPGGLEFKKHSSAFAFDGAIMAWKYLSIPGGYISSLGDIWGNC